MSSFRRDPSYPRDLQQGAERIFNLLKTEGLAKKRSRRQRASCSGDCQGSKDAYRAEAGRLANVAGLTGSAQQRDTEIAHLTLGEIVVPLHAQTPAVMSALSDALGASLARYVVGSTVAQHNPVSGYPAFPEAAVQQKPHAGLLSELGAIGDFLRNYNDMKRAGWKGADRYFHCKANFEASRRGGLGRAIAEGLSDLKEWSDQTFKGYPLADTQADQAINRYGREVARKGMFATGRDACSRLRPPGLPKQY